MELNMNKNEFTRVRVSGLTELCYLVDVKLEKLSRYGAPVYVVYYNHIIPGYHGHNPESKITLDCFNALIKDGFIRGIDEIKMEQR